MKVLGGMGHGDGRLGEVRDHVSDTSHHQSLRSLHGVTARVGEGASFCWI